MSDRVYAKDARNHDTIITLGRVLFDALAGYPHTPEMNARENSLEESEPFVEAYITIEARSSDQVLTPEVMGVLADFGLSVRPRDEEEWENGFYAEWEAEIPDEVYDAYERAAGAWGVPEAPRKWSDEDRTRWTHEQIMRTFHGAEKPPA